MTSSSSSSSNRRRRTTTVRMTTSVSALLCVLAFLSLLTPTAANINPLVDTKGKLVTPLSSDASIANGVATIITSEANAVLDYTTVGSAVSASSLVHLTSETDVVVLQCQGATLASSPTSALSLCSLLSQVIVLTGVHPEECSSDLVFCTSRHARTLSALFRARVSAGVTGPQTLLVADADPTSSLRVLFRAAAAAADVKVTFEECYDVEIVAAADASVTYSARASAVCGSFRTFHSTCSLFPFFPFFPFSPHSKKHVHRF